MSEVIQGAAKGAGIGSFAGPIGTAAGALIGAAGSLIGGQQSYKNQKKLIDYQTEKQKEYQKYFNQLDLEHQVDSVGALFSGYKQAGLNPAALAGNAYNTATPASGSASAPPTSDYGLGSSFAGFGSVVSQSILASEQQKINSDVANAQIVKDQAEAKKLEYEAAIKKTESEWSDRLYQNRFESEQLEIIYKRNKNEMWQYEKDIAIETANKLKAEVKNLSQLFVNNLQEYKILKEKVVQEQFISAMQDKEFAMRWQKAMSEVYKNRTEGERIEKLLPGWITELARGNRNLYLEGCGLQISNKEGQIHLKLDENAMEMQDNAIYTFANVLVQLLGKILGGSIGVTKLVK